MLNFLKMQSFFDYLRNFDVMSFIGHKAVPRRESRHERLQQQKERGHSSREILQREHRLGYSTEMPIVISDEEPDDLEGSDSDVRSICENPVLVPVIDDEGPYTYVDGANGANEATGTNVEPYTFTENDNNDEDHDKSEVYSDRAPVIDAKTDEQGAKWIMYRSLGKPSIRDKDERFEYIMRRYSGHPGKIFEDIASEYRVEGPLTDDEVHECCCGTKIHQYYYAKNILTNNRLIVGNECVNRLREDDENDSSDDFVQNDDESIEYEDGYGPKSKRR